MKRTKIICTMGPATNDREVVRQLAMNGMDVARFNFSHGDHEEQKGRADLVKSVREELGKPIALLLDTKGPEIRTGVLKEHKKIALSDGQQFTLTTQEIEGDEQRVSITYEGLPEDVSAGSRILIDDGLIELEVVSSEGTEIVCKVLNGGELGERKGVNVPNVKVKLPGITEKDRQDILFGIEQGFDFIAASFVRTADVIREIRTLLDENGGQQIAIIAKIENAEGIENIEEIIKEADGIMVARGDMGVEIPFIKLPEIRKTLIRKCVARGKYVITATQMLESMTTAPRPTRAEISDVANAVYDGTSAVMLSAESAAGKYPVESVKALDAICTEAENNGEFTALHEYIEAHSVKDKNAIRGSICKAAKEIAAEVGAKAIIVESATGRVARAMVHFRPEVPVIAVVTSQLVCRKLCLNWGVTALIGEEKRTSDAITKQAMEKALSTGLVHKGDTVVVLSSNRTCPTSSTDSLNIRIL